MKTKMTKPAKDSTAGTAARGDEPTGTTGDGRPGSTGHDGVALPVLGFIGMLRWAWTQLTSMRTALFLLLLLAVAAVPGSLFPQRPSSPEAVTQYLKDNPGTGPWLDRFQLFDVYSSAWFSAIYILLFISLIGCVIPRTIQHAKAMRSQPPRTPKRLSRLPEYGTVAIPATAGTTAAGVIDRAAALLKKRGYRVQVREGARPSVGAERGFTKEIGNLLFHFCLMGVLVSVALGGLFGYSGQRIVVEGDTFVNTLVGYDTFTPGNYFSEGELDPYSIRLDDFHVKFDRESKAHYGQPLDFTANVTTKDSAGAKPKKQVLKVNDPLKLGGTNVYLVGNGYAPVVTVRDGNGDVALKGPVVAIPSDGAYTSLMVIKAPDAKPDQLGFVGFFLPTALVGKDGVAFASDPDPYNPQLNLNSFTGDLGLDKGDPKSVYALDTSKMKQLNGRDLKAGGIVLAAHQTYKLPDGKGSISFDGLKRYVALDIHHNPGQVSALIFASLALAGLIMSLFIGRRRAWIRTGDHPDGRVMIEYGLLARGEDHRLGAEAGAIRRLLEREWLATAGGKDENGNVAHSNSADSNVAHSNSADSNTADSNSADSDSAGSDSAGKDQ